MRRLITASALALAFSPVAAQEMGYGQAEYLDSCSVCHGHQGLADGPLADLLETPPADLTALSRENGGEFPYWRVFAVIDGRYIVPGHGDRDMPVWGRQFLQEDTKVHGPNGGENATVERIHELAGYVETLQR